MSFKDKIDTQRLPQHVAIIMDGNGRWAKMRGKPRTFGHKAGVTAVREATEAATELGIKYLTLFAFSTENWKRPRLEVDALMTLLLQTLNAELENLNKNNIRLMTVGDLDSLPIKVKAMLRQTVEQTAGHTRMTLTLALSYSGRWEILQAAKRIAKACMTGEITPEDIDEKTFSSFLETSHLPNPELLIRTSGEYRISNFMLWQLAYSELTFTSKYWPDFKKEDLYQAVYDFQQRERRFGKTTEQLVKEGKTTT